MWLFNVVHRENFTNISGTFQQSAGDTDPRLLARLLMGHPQGMAQLVHDHARILAISCGLGGAKGGGSLLLRHSVA